MATALRSLRSAYRTAAVIDWLQLEIEFARPTQFQWPQRTLKEHFGGDTRSYIEPVNAGAGNMASRFLLRLNDAHCRDANTIRSGLAALDHQYTLVGPVLIKALEVSLDFYPNDDQAHADLLQLVARLQMSLEAPDGRNHRLVGVRPGGTRARPDFLDSTRTPDPNQTFYVNDNDHDPLSWRVYHKSTDRERELPRQEHRARAEFTLRRAGLHKYGINSLEDLEKNGFVGFRELLHFRRFRPVSELATGRRPVVAYALQHGTRHYRNMIALYPFGRHAYYLDSRTGKPRNGARHKLRGHSTHTESDDELNHLVRDRLRDLSRKFHTKLEAKS